MYKRKMRHMAADDSFVIEELSRRTGMTVRSIRAYQSRKLLPPPEVRGRTGYYDERHVARIELIKDLQSEGLKLDDPLTKERTHDYLLFSSPRKVKEKTESLVLLARVPSKFEVWPKNIEDYSFSLQTASNIVAPPTMFGEVTKLDKGPAIEILQRKHHLRPFMLDVYRVEYVYE